MAPLPIDKVPLRVRVPEFSSKVPATDALAPDASEAEEPIVKLP